MQTINNNWENVLGNPEPTPSVWMEFLGILEQASWSDYSILLLLILALMVGFKRGFALGLINFIWIITAIIVASMFFTKLGESGFWLFKRHELISFATVFLAVLLLKIGLYKVLAKIAKIHGPCPLNRFLAICIGLSIGAGISWILANNTAHIEIISRLITNAELRIIASFILIFGGIIISVFVLIKILNIKVGTDQPCPLLLALKPLDSILSAKSINSPINNFFGLWLGLFKGVILVVLIIIIFNQNELLLQGRLTAEFSAIAANTQNVLADYLTFIKK